MGTFIEVPDPQEIQTYSRGGRCSSLRFTLGGLVPDFGLGNTRQRTILVLRDIIGGQGDTEFSLPNLNPHRKIFELDKDIIQRVSVIFSENNKGPIEGALEYSDTGSVVLRFDGQDAQFEIGNMKS